jgi:hypothetical protein
LEGYGCRPVSPWGLKVKRRELALNRAAWMDIVADLSLGVER